MHIPPLLSELIIIFLISIVVNTLCSRLRLPTTVGFLLTGVLCGPSLMGIVHDRHSIDILSEMGVALLLFTIGLELSGDALAHLKKPVFLGGSLQLGLTIAAIVTLLFFLKGVTIPVGIFIGCLVTLSSSAIVLRLLQEKGTTGTPAGKLTLAILVFQDIMVAPMMLAVPILGGTMHLSGTDALMAIVRVVLVMSAVLLFARFGLNTFMAAVVRTRVRELLLLTTLGLCMGMALLTAWLGLSLSLGAFLAGLFLARSEYSMSVVSGVLPYRDVFMSIFFISVGMLLNVDHLMTHFTFITLGTVVFILLKTLLVLPAVLMQRYPLRTAIIVALTLAQVGEFAFVLAGTGVDVGLLNNESYQNFLAISILTMMCTPALMALAPRLADILTGKHKKAAGTASDTPEDDEAVEGSSTLQNHLIIVGFGISGQHLASVAKKCSIPYEILEMNPDTVSRFRDSEPIHYGDASQPAVLEHLGIKKAKVLAIVISDPTAVQAAVIEARNLNPQMRIVARTRFLTQVKPLYSLGASDVVAEEFETSIEVFSCVLNQYMVPKQDIEAFTLAVRRENYAMLRTRTEQSGSLDDLVEQLPNVGTQAIRLEPLAPLCGKSLHESALRRTHGVTVVAISHKGSVTASPSAEYIFQEEDIIYVFGEHEHLAKASALFRPVIPSPDFTDDLIAPHTHLAS